MIFNQLAVFSIQSIPQTSTAELEELLNEKPFVPTLSQQIETTGWHTLINQRTLWSTEDTTLLKMRREQRSVPPGVIRDVTEQRCADIEPKPGREEQLKIKEAVLLELLPQAFPTRQDSYLLIDHKHQQLWVNQTADKRISQLTTLLRDSLEPKGGLQIQPLLGTEPLNARLSNWLLNGPPAGFELGDSAKLVDPNEGGQVTISRLGLPDDNVLAHLRDGLSAEQLELVFQDQIRFTLKADGHLTKIKVLTETDDMPDMDLDDPAVRFEADLRLITAQIRGLIHALHSAISA